MREYTSFAGAAPLDHVNPPRELNYFGSELVQEMIAGIADRQYTNHPMLGRISTSTPGGRFWHLYDVRQNLIATLDGASMLRELIRYDDFGFPTITAVGPSSGFEPVFGGMRYLNFPGTTFGATPPNWPSGLYLGMFRVMDSYNGTWLSPDPLGYLDSPNRNAYVAQNPLSFVDPLGLSAGANKSNLEPASRTNGFR